MLSTRVLCYGTDESLPERVPLRAGPLSLFWEGGDLRTIKLGGREVLRRIYVATRDRNWGTTANVISNVVMDVQADAFGIRYDVENRQDDIHFVWHGEIACEADGTIRFSMDGVAKSTFLKNRIGFCILHPADIAGARCCVEHVDGRSEAATLPMLLVPDQPLLPFAEMAGMTHEVTPGVWAGVHFTGDVFEMEDQRNWTDASFKTFSTPLRLSYPVEVPAGTRIAQTVTLALRDERSDQRVKFTSAPESPTFAIDAAAPASPLPPIGLGMASHGAPLTATEISRLRALNLRHLRVDLVLADRAHPARLRQATAEARALGVPLEIALRISPDSAETELGALRLLLDEWRPNVCRWLVFSAKELFRGGSPLREVIEPARTHLAGYGEAGLVSGTDADFVFLARSLPPLELVDALTFAITPQVHAFDNSSIVETLATEGAAVHSARALAAGKPVYVSPVTLKMRDNPYATGAIPPTPPGGLPPQVDPRQMSLFAACWALGSVRNLAQSGAAGITYFETTGWRGVMETERGSPAPDKFRSIPGAVFPVYHVLADIGEFAGGEVLAGRPSDALAVDGIALRRDDRLRVLIANMTDAPQSVTVPGLHGRIELWLFAASNAERAMCKPEAWRARPSERLEPPPIGGVTIDLPPFAVARLDCLEAR
jgi:D-apionolactonase